MRRPEGLLHPMDRLQKLALQWILTVLSVWMLLPFSMGMATLAFIIVVLMSMCALKWNVLLTVAGSLDVLAMCATLQSDLSEMGPMNVGSFICLIRLMILHFLFPQR